MTERPEAGGGDPLYEFYGGDDDGGDWPPCPTCHGCGTVNPLTAPEGFFCVSTTECPTCEGTGDCP